MSKITENCTREQLTKYLDERKAVNTTGKWPDNIREALLELYPTVESITKAAGLYILGWQLSDVPTCKYCQSPVQEVNNTKGVFKAKFFGWNNICQDKKCVSRKNIDSGLEKRGGKHHLSKDCQDQTSREKQRQTTLKNHGVDHISKSKEIQEKKIETILEKNNGYHYMDHRSGSGVTEKIKKTVQETYGHDYYFQTDRFKESFEQTSMERYGVASPNSSPIVQKKKEETIATNYGKGYINPGQVPEIKERIKNTTLENWENGHPSRDQAHMLGRRLRSIEKYGAPFIQQTPEFKRLSRLKRLTNRRSKSETDSSNRFFDLLIGLDEKNALLAFLEELKGSGMDMTRISVAEKAGISPWDMGNLINRYQECREYISYHPIRSNQERILCDILQPIVSKIEHSNRKVIAPKELDILIDDKVAIEVNGIFYHSEVNGGKYPTYHLEKTNMANAAGVKLFHFYDTEITQRQDIVVSMIKNACGYSEQSYQARKLEVCKIGHDEYVKFFHDNHIQGSIVGSDCYALKEGDSIKFAMLVGKPRFNKQHQWEVLRVASELGCNVSGGFGRVWSAFMKEHDPESIICYQDRRFGGMKSVAYGSCMTLIDTTNPGWSGVDLRNYCVRNRSYYMKHRFSLIDGYDDSKSVLDNMITMNHDRIWNCGQFVWSWKKIATDL